MRDKNPHLEELEVDVALIQETFFKHKFKIPNNTTYRTDRLHNRVGGVMKLVKTSIPHHQIDKAATDNKETAGIQTEMHPKPQN